MNQTAEQYDLGFGVYQKNYEWFVSFRNPNYTLNGDVPYWFTDSIEFHDGMEFSTNWKERHG